MTGRDMTEAQFQSAVMDLCRLRGLLVHHCRAARTAAGTWSTPITGDVGFPDLVIAGPSGVLLRELKTERGQASPAQAVWAQRLERAGANYALWRPSDLASGRVDKELREISGQWTATQQEQHRGEAARGWR